MKLRYNLLVLLLLLAAYTFYIIAYGYLHWYQADAKWISYSATAIGLLYFCFEELAGYIDWYYRQFNIIGKLTIAVNCIIFALNFQGVLSDPVLLLLALYISVAVISIAVHYNLKKYEYL